MEIEGWTNIHAFLIWKCTLNKSKSKLELYEIKVNGLIASVTHWQDLSDEHRIKGSGTKVGMWILSYCNFGFWADIAIIYVKSLLNVRGFTCAEEPAVPPVVAPDCEHHDVDATSH